MITAVFGAGHAAAPGKKFDFYYWLKNVKKKKKKASWELQSKQHTKKNQNGIEKVSYVRTKCHLLSRAVTGSSRREGTLTQGLSKEELTCQSD